MLHNIPTSDRFDAAEIDEWTNHRSRNSDKADKRRASIYRQLGRGVPVEQLASIIVPLHRQTNAFDGNGSYAMLLEQLGIEPKFHKESIAPVCIEIDSKEQEMTQRIDYLLAELTETYGSFIMDEHRPPVQFA